ncbi:MAG: flagellar assembly protein FliH [Methylovulum sp.]|nr:flagellar assembly protein FliH [Methylovulum sp.]
MLTYNSSGFSPSELAALNLWRVPDVFHAKPEPEAPEEDEPEETAAVDIEEEEPVVVLTVEEIEAMQKQAYNEAFAQGKNDGFQQGFAEGSKKGYDENVHLLQQQAKQFTSLLESLSGPFKHLDDEVEKELVKLAIGIATQIIRREIKLNPGQVVAAAKEAINVLPLSSQKITVHLHPEDSELVRSALSLDDMPTTWKIIEDPLITRGGCKIDTEVSHVDATIEHRLAAVIANVLGSERQQDKPL